MATKADEAYEMLLDLIESGALAPSEFLSETLLMERFDLGRTPLREALQRLNLERMIEIVPGRGVQVAPNSVDAQLQRLELRRSVEALAYSLACRRATAPELDQLAELTGRLRDAEDIDAYRIALRATQTAIVEAAHNDYMIPTMVPLQGLSRRFWLAHLGHGAKDSLQEGKRHHLRALDAVLARDAAEAQLASRALNDYLVEFSLRVLRARASHGIDVLEPEA